MEGGGCSEMLVTFPATCAMLYVTQQGGPDGLDAEATWCPGAGSCSSSWGWTTACVVVKNSNSLSSFLTILPYDSQAKEMGGW